jgi:hypothetical protein
MTPVEFSNCTARLSNTQLASHRRRARQIRLRLLGFRPAVCGRRTWRLAFLAFFFLA